MFEIVCYFLMPHTFFSAEVKGEWGLGGAWASFTVQSSVDGTQKGNNNQTVGPSVLDSTSIHCKKTHFKIYFYEANSVFKMH